MVERRRYPGIVPDDFGIVGRIEPRLCRMCAVSDVVADGRAACKRQSIAHDNLFLRINPNDPVIELVADEGVSIVEPKRPGRQWIEDAEWVGVGEVLTDLVVVGIDLNDASMTGISQEGVSVGKATGKCAGTEGALSGEGPNDLMASGNLDRSIVVFVCDEDMAVGEEFGGVGAVELVSWVVVRPGVLPDDVAVHGDFDNAVVALVGDEDVEAWQPCGLYWRIEQVES